MLLHTVGPARVSAARIRSTNFGSGHNTGVPCRPASSHVRGSTWAAARTEKQRPATASDRTRLVQHFGPDAEDVEHMSERYIDEQLPGAVQVPRCEDPRPRLPPGSFDRMPVLPPELVLLSACP